MNKEQLDYLAAEQFQRTQTKHGLSALDDVSDLRWSMVAVKCFKLGYKLALSGLMAKDNFYDIVISTNGAIIDTMAKQRDRLQKMLADLG